MVSVWLLQTSELYLCHPAIEETCIETYCSFSDSSPQTPSLWRSQLLSWHTYDILQGYSSHLFSWHKHVWNVTLSSNRRCPPETAVPWLRALSVWYAGALAWATLPSSATNRQHSSTVMQMIPFDRTDVGMFYVVSLPLWRTVLFLGKPSCHETFGYLLHAS